MRKFLALLTVALVVIAACGDDATDATGGPAPTEPPTGGLTPLAPETDGDAAMGPGISVADLLASAVDGPYVVNGYLFVATDGSVVLADEIAESYPPQPAGAQVPVEGANTNSFPLVEAVEGEIAIAQWTESTIQLLGGLVNGVLVVDTTSK